ncbi:MAG: hypothetical protein OXC97_01825, partial [Candidatus Dadabacteria bacterium]|nr:hypothetical protein [Candidatus Dadabacteria bacterium]
MSKNKGKTDEENRKFLMELLRADDEDTVISILKSRNYWDKPEVWREYGDRSGNFSTIGNQQSRPEAALVEKIINSVDARLMNECLVKGIDPKSSNAPSSIRHAVAKFFEGKEINAESGGTIRDWPQKQRTEESRNITLAATGIRQNPCLTIADIGEGQTPNDLPETFLSIDRENKLRVPFVQGKFNMGGTGALKFCGENRFQLVISRRNPALVAAARKKTDSSAELWGFTIVRRELPILEIGAVRNSVYKYLAPVLANDDKAKRGVLRFYADSLPLMPEHNQPYERHIKWGSALKLYNYDMKGFKSHLLMKDGLLYRLEILMPEIALPVRLHECRNFKGTAEASFATSLSGLVARLEDGRGGNLENGFPHAVPFQVEGHNMVARIYAFQKGKAQTYRTNEGIVFTINGQTHGSIPKTIFARNKVKMHRLADSLLVLVDCSKISVSAREDLFMNSRDRLSSGHLRGAIEKQMEDILANHQPLRDLRERRRQSEISERLEASKPLEDVLSSILRSSPTLASLFLKGPRLNNPFKRRGGQATGKDGSEAGKKLYSGKPHPTFFKFHKKRQGESLEREADIGKRCRIKFDTDVANGYFERSIMPGRFLVKLADRDEDTVSMDSNLILHNGYGNWSIELPDNVNVGDRLSLKCCVSDDVNPDGFTNILTLTIVNQSGGGKGNGKRRSRTAGGSETGDEEPFGIKLPDIKRVRQEDWPTANFDEFSSTKVIADTCLEDGEEKTVHTFYVNIDNKYLKTEMKDAKSDISLIEAKFVYGNVLLGLALIRDNNERRTRSNSSHDESSVVQETDIYEQIKLTSRALAPFLVPMINSLGSLADEDVV